MKVETSIKKNVKYLVTTATGNTGYHVASQLLDKGSDVRVMSRTNNNIIRELKEQGAEVVLGSITSESELQQAISGVQRVYYCHPIIPNLLANTKMFARLAKQEKIEAVVNIGQYLAELKNHPSKQTNEHKQGYQILDDANIGASHVIPGWFADNAMNTALFISQLGYLPFPLGKGRSPVVSNEDIAAVAVSILQDPVSHVGKRYQPTGPKSISMKEMLDSFQRVLGRKVNHMPMPDFLFNKAIIQMGFNPYLLSQLKLYVQDFQNNVFNYEPTDIVEKITGKKAEDFDVIAKRYFDQNNLMDRTWALKFKAIKQFMSIGFTNAPNAKKLKLMNQ